MTPVYKVKCEECGKTIPESEACGLPLCDKCLDGLSAAAEKTFDAVAILDKEGK